MGVCIYRKIIDFFGFNVGSTAALEISATAVKVLQLSKAEGKIKVDCYAIEPLDAGAATACIVKAIKTALSKAQLKTTKVRVAIASSKVISKILKMSAQLSDKDIACEIELEIDKYFPYPAEEMCFDYAIVSASEDSNDEVDVLLTAAKLQHITDITNIVTAAGLVPVAVDVDVYAIARSFRALIQKNDIISTNKTFAIFDISIDFIIVIIISNNRVLYVREQILQELHHSTESQLIQLYKEFIITVGVNVVDGIYLFGDGINLVGLDEFLEQQLQITSYLVNPSFSMELQSGISKTQFAIDAFGLMKCCGLALRDIN